MTRRKGRGLRPEERALWGRVEKTLRPLNPARPELPEALRPAPVPPPRPAPISPFRIGEKTAAGGTALADGVVAPPSPVDKKALGRLKRGKLRPEARIDLHGLTQDQALGELTGFILRQSAAGRRLVLVITGKGRGGADDGPIPERPGALRRNLPHWLHSGQLAGLVLDLIEAHPRHGGGGAFYVWLKRRRG